MGFLQCESEVKGEAGEVGRLRTALFLCLIEYKSKCAQSTATKDGAALEPPPTPHISQTQSQVLLCSSVKPQPALS